MSWIWIITRNSGCFNQNSVSFNYNLSYLLILTRIFWWICVLTGTSDSFVKTIGIPCKIIFHQNIFLIIQHCGISNWKRPNLNEFKLNAHGNLIILKRHKKLYILNSCHLAIKTPTLKHYTFKIRNVSDETKQF